MKLSNQALGALMMALQKSLMEQSDIVPVLKEFNFNVDDNEELVCLNPPSFKVPQTITESDFDTNSTTGSD